MTDIEQREIDWMNEGNPYLQATSREDKKTILKNLSLKAKKIKKEYEAINPEIKINEILKSLYSEKMNTKTEEKSIFRTYNGWKKEGYKVKKGAKAYLLWTKPIKATAKKEILKDEKNEYEFFGVANLFNNLQVDKS